MLNPNSTRPMFARRDTLHILRNIQAVPLQRYWKESDGRVLRTNRNDVGSTRLIMRYPALPQPVRRARLLPNRSVREFSSGGSGFGSDSGGGLAPEISASASDQGIDGNVRCGRSRCRRSCGVSVEMAAIIMHGRVLHTQGTARC